MSHGTGVRIVLKETGINLIMFIHGSYFSEPSGIHCIVILEDTLYESLPNFV